MMIKNMRLPKREFELCWCGKFHSLTPPLPHPPDFSSPFSPVAACRLYLSHCSTFLLCQIAVVSCLTLQHFIWAYWFWPCQSWTSLCPGKPDTTRSLKIPFLCFSDFCSSKYMNFSIFTAVWNYPSALVALTKGPAPGSLVLGFLYL